MANKNSVIWLDGMLNSCCRQSQCKVSDFPVNLSRYLACTSWFFILIVSVTIRRFQINWITATKITLSHKRILKIFNISYLSNVVIRKRNERYIFVIYRYFAWIRPIYYLELSKCWLPYYILQALICDKSRAPSSTEASQKSKQYPHTPSSLIVREDRTCLVYILTWHS